jgi:surface antigen
MKKIIIALAATMAIAGCTTAEQDAAGGAVVGAAVGGLATGRVGGAVAGAVIGGAAGVLLGQATRRGECRYRDRRGRVYIAACPAGYY